MPTETEIRDVLTELSCCGKPELVLEKLQATLEILATRATQGPGRDAAWKKSFVDLEALLGPQSSADYWFWLYVLDHLRLTDHGTSCSGSWLTDLGAEALAFLRKHGPDSESWPKEAW